MAASTKQICCSHEDGAVPMRGKCAGKSGKDSAGNSKNSAKRPRGTSIQREGIPVSTKKVEEDALNRGISAKKLEDRPNGSRSATQSDLTGVSGKDFSAGESAADLMREGQDLEAELVEAVEDAPEVDENEVPAHRDSRSTIPDYKNRNRL
jgi:hypothetical protein